MRRSIWLVLVCSGLFASSTTPLHAGTEFVLAAEEVTVGPGSSVGVSVLLDNDEAIDALQFGLAYDPSELSLTGSTQGSALAATNGGSGPDYYFTEIDPDGEAGFVFGAVISLSLPFDDIDPGVQHNIVTLDFTGALGVPTATVSLLEFTEELGDPTIDVVVAIGSTAIVPTMVPGEVVFNPAPPENLVCTPVSPCLLDYDITWSNPTSYGSIQVFVDGALVESLVGFSTSTTVSFVDQGIHEVCLVGRFGTLESEPACCTFLADPLPDTVGGVSCEVDPDTCLGTVTWINTEPYDSIEIYHDGVLSETLPGTATSTTLLTDEIAIEVSIVPINVCGVGNAAICNVACGVNFIRGDCNLDFALDIADAIAGLAVLFAGDPSPGCDDACDANDDGGFDIADMIYVLGTLFSSGPNPPAPFPDCGPDTTDDPLGCVFGCV